MHLIFFLPILSAAILIVILVAISIVLSGSDMWKKLRAISLKEMLFSWAVLSIILLIPLGFAVVFGSNANAIVMTIIVIISVLMGSSYSFIVEPILLHWNKERINTYTIASGYRVVETAEPVYNVYATGVLPFSKTIIIGKDLDKQLTNCELSALLHHEIYHHKASHMLKLFMVTSILFSLAAIINLWVVLPYVKGLGLSASAEALRVSLFWGGIGCINVLASGLVQRRFEKQADLYSVRQMGSYAQISALRKLYALSGTPENQKAINYPTLAQRERYVREKAPGLPD